MRRGDLYRYEPVLARAGQSTIRLIVSADAVNTNDALPAVYVMYVVDVDAMFAVPARQSRGPPPAPTCANLGHAK